MLEWLNAQIPGSIYVFFVIGFLLLIKGADWLVEGASAIARRMNISDLVIGLTIVSFGTSAPELVVNLVASFSGNPDIAIGNIIGSNIANIFLILGIASLIYPLAVQTNTVWKEIPYSMLAALVVFLLVNDVLAGDARNILSRLDGGVLIAFFFIFLVYTMGLAKQENLEDEIEDMPLPKAVTFTCLGLVALPVGGDWIVSGAVHVARMVGVTEAVISLTIIAIGTSLPEVAASAMAALKRKADIAIGNAVGSNIFNVFWVLGCSAIIRPIPFKDESNSDVAVAFLASFLLFLFVVIPASRRLERWQGGLFIVLYVVYLVYLVGFSAGGIGAK